MLKYPRELILPVMRNFFVLIGLRYRQMWYRMTSHLYHSRRRDSRHGVPKRSLGVFPLICAVKGETRAAARSELLKARVGKPAVSGGAPPLPICNLLVEKMCQCSQSMTTTFILRSPLLSKALPDLFKTYLSVRKTAKRRRALRNATGRTRPMVV